jgi:hypothetical protein
MSAAGLVPKPFFSLEADIPRFLYPRPTFSARNRTRQMEPMLLQQAPCLPDVVIVRSLTCYVHAATPVAPLAGIRSRAAGRCVCQRQRRDRSDHRRRES